MKNKETKDCLKFLKQIEKRLREDLVEQTKEIYKKHNPKPLGVKNKG